MEDFSNTPDKEVKYDLRFYITKDLLEDECFYQFLKENNVDFNSKINECDLLIQKSGELVLFKDPHDKFSHTTSRANLINSLVFFLRNHISKKQLPNANKENLSKYISRISRFQSRSAEQSKCLQILNTHLEKSDDLAIFARKLFLLRPFKKFQTIHLFIHEKGKANTQHIEVARDFNRSYMHPVTEFNNLFQSIKKSKNRSFGQTYLKGFNFEIIGTFLAHEFFLKNYNLILIVSRNDFLPQSVEEVTFFNFLAKNLSSYIEILLEKKMIQEKITRLQNTLHEAPFEIHLNSVADDYKNFNSTNMYFLNDGSPIEIIPLFKELINHADVFHHERVSLLGELLNTLRHELSNPLFGLQLSTELLLMDVDNLENKDFLNEILISIKRSQSIIESFSKLYKDSEESESIDVIQLINEVFTLTKSESRHLKKLVNSENKKVILNTNSTWLAQIFFNLVINSAQALKSSIYKNAEFVINIDIICDKIIFHIQDNGPGISKEQSYEIFKAFYTTKSKGTGLGLAIARSLAQKLNGNLTCIEDDNGAHFLLELPYENSSR